MTWYQNMTTGKITSSPSGNVESLRLFSNQVRMTKRDREVKQQQTIKAKAAWVKHHNEIYKNKLAKEGD